MAGQPDLSKYPSTGDLETDARLAAAYEDYSMENAMHDRADISDAHDMAGYKDCPVRQERAFSADHNTQREGKDMRSRDMPGEQDTVRHPHHHENVHCSVVHHHHYAGRTSPTRLHRGQGQGPAAGTTIPARSHCSQDHGPAAGPGPRQPVSHRGPLTSTSGSPFDGYCFSRRILTPFELANPCTCRQRDTQASSRTRSRSRGPSSRTLSRSRNDSDSTRRFHPVSGPALDTHQ